jgi:hypothetical protein
VGNQINIFIDESGDFGFGDGHAEYYVVSFVIHDIKDSITNQINYFNQKLENLEHIGMVHLGDLVHGNNSYKGWSIDERKSVMWSTIFFAQRCPIKYHSLIINRRFINNDQQLNQTLFRTIKSFIEVISPTLDSYDKIKIYYDNEQKRLATIFDTAFINYNVERVSDFDKDEKRLFQVADLLTYVDKTIYKYDNQIKLSKTEEIFFSKPNISIKNTIKSIRKKLKKNRI